MPNLESSQPSPAGLRRSYLSNDFLQLFYQRAARFRRRLERGVEGRLHAPVSYVVHAPAVDEKGGRAFDPDLLAVGQVALHLVGEPPGVERRVELRAVEAEHLRVLLELVNLERRL